MDKEAKRDYWELLDKLVDCEQGSEREFAIYQESVEISDAEIKATEEEAKADVFDPQTGKLLSEQPIFLDDFAAPMDNLARIYIDREEFDKALPLLEKVLPIYRTLEIRNAKYTYQRYYATKAMIDCLRKVGKDTLAVLYEFELKHLRRDVLKDENID